MNNIDINGDNYFRNKARDSFNLLEKGVWTMDSVTMWSRKGVISYNNLQNFSTYSDNITNNEVGFIKKHTNDIGMFLPESIDLFDLGMGTAVKTIIFIKHLLQLGKKIKYTGIDISPDMIEIATLNLKSNNLSGEFVRGDLNMVLDKVKNDGRSLVTIFGLTLFSEKLKRTSLVEQLVEKNNFVFFTFEPKEKTDIETEKRNYTSKEAMPFHEANLSLLDLEFGVHVNNIEISDEIAVYVTVIKLNNFLSERGVKVGDKIVLGYSYRPKIIDLSNIFETEKIQANLFDDGETFAGVLLSPRKKIDLENIYIPKLDDDHPFKPFFEGDEGKKAYKRMVSGSLELEPFLEMIISQGRVMEVGPFYDPLITKEKYPNCEIVYIDRDNQALKFLESEKVRTRYFEFGLSADSDLNDLSEQDYIVTSHIVNHVGLPHLVNTLKTRLKVGGYLFMNESIDYGGDGIMHEDRPKTIDQILDYLRSNGFITVVYRIIPTSNPIPQPNPRLVVVARRIS